MLDSFDERRASPREVSNENPGPGNNHEVVLILDWQPRST
jgi:hypothetical protein